ncbi:TPA: hypothetical protein ACWMJU_006019 [Pseudomonas aeruginosa]
MFYDDEIASTVQTDWEAWTNGKWDIEPERKNPVAEYIFANEDEIEFTYEEPFFTPAFLPPYLLSSSLSCSSCAFPSFI